MQAQNCWLVGGQFWGVEYLEESGVEIVWVESIADGRLLGARYNLVGKPMLLTGRLQKAMAKSFVESLLKKRKAQKAETDAAYDEELANEVPHVHELLSRKIQDGKKTIDPASLIIFCREGAFNACLSHKGIDLKWFGKGSTLREALKALETAIGHEEGQETNGR